MLVLYKMQNSLAASGMLPDDFRTKQKVLPPKRVLCFGGQAGCGDATSLYKNLVKNRKTKTNFCRQAIQEPIFSVANADFEGGYDGRGCGVRYFFGQIGPTQPYDMPYSIRVLHSQSARG